MRQEPRTEEGLSEQRQEEVLKDSGGVEKLLEDLEEMLTEDEWTTVHPIARLNEMLMTHCRSKQDGLLLRSLMFVFFCGGFKWVSVENRPILTFSNSLSVRTS